MRRAGVAALLISLCVAVGGQQPAGNGAAALTSKQAWLTLKQIWTIDRTYSDPLHGVTFGYPSVWKPGTQFGYHPPALTMSDAAKPIAGFGYEEDGVGQGRAKSSPYSPTSLEGFGIVYSAVPAESAAACEAKAAEIADSSATGTLAVDGRTFSVRKTFSGAMNQYENGKLYATFVAPNCYLFETSVAGSILPQEDGGGRPLSDAQIRFIESHLEEIMKTVRIAAAK